MKFVDLFSGLGGASEGSKMANVDVALAVDSDRDALAVHKMNHPKCKHLCVALPSTSIPLPRGALHIHASPPCQAVSQANRSVGKTREKDALRLVAWAVNFCRKHATTWSLEQVSSVGVCNLLTEMGVHFEVFNFQHLGVAQTRKRVIAGSPQVVQAVREAASRNSRVLSVRDVIPHCRGDYIKNATTSTWQVQHGKRRQIRLTEDHPSFVRHISQPAYTVTGKSPLRWYSPDGCVMFSPQELALVQGFPENYKLHDRQGLAYEQVGNALPPPVASLIVMAARRAARLPVVQQQNRNASQRLKRWSKKRNC